jgi:putative hydrolase of the HAD superfamily
MEMSEVKELEEQGVKGVALDCYKTLIDIQTDEDSIETYEAVSNWLIYQGVKIEPGHLMHEYKRLVKEGLDSMWEMHPEVRVEEIFSQICRENAIWQIDEVSLGKETARAFRAASLRRFRPFPQSLRLLEMLADYPLAIVSNGQRVFSELELRYFGLDSYFKTIIFSSDDGHKKPDPRIFLTACRKLDLQPEEMLFIGDNMDHDVIPATKLGMKAMHVEEAWKFFKVL